MPVLDEDGDRRFGKQPGVGALEPVIPPAGRFGPPFDSGAGDSVVREGMVPRTDQRLDWCRAGGDHPWDRVAVAVVPAADQEGRHREPAIVGPQRGAPPVGPVLLLAEPAEQPWLAVETRSQHVL